MSEEAVKDAPGEAATEVPAATTNVEEGGPTSFKEAADQFFSENKETAVAPAGDDPVDMNEFLAPPEEKKAPEEAEKPAETTEKAPEEPEAEAEVPEFGFEKDGETEPPPEAFDADAFDKETEEQVGSIEDPKAQDGWRKLRARVKDAETRAAEASKVEEKAAELEKVTVRMAELEAQNEQLQQSDYVLKVQASPEWAEKVQGPTTQIKELANQIATEYAEEGITSEEVLNAIREPGLKRRGERIQALRDKGVDDLIVSEVQNGHNAFRKLQADHESMLSNAETEWKKVEAQREADQLKSAEEERRLLSRHLDENWEKATKIFGEDKISGPKRRSAMIDIRDETPGNRAYAQMAGEAFPLALAEIKSLKAQLSEAGVKAKVSQQSTASLSEGAVEKSDEVEDATPKTFAEASRRFGNLSL